jgi:hypothetical protein
MKRTLKPGGVYRVLGDSQPFIVNSRATAGLIRSDRAL